MRHLLEAWNDLQNVGDGTQLIQWINNHFTGDEGQYLEFKQAIDTSAPSIKPLPKKKIIEIALQEICAFANSGGGILLIGVKDREDWGQDPVDKVIQDSSGTRTLRPDASFLPSQDFIRSLTSNINSSFFPIVPDFRIDFIRAGFVAVLVDSPAFSTHLIKCEHGFIGGYIKQGEQKLRLTPEQVLDRLGDWKLHSARISSLIEALDDRFSISPSPLTSGSNASFVVTTLPVREYTSPDEGSPESDELDGLPWVPSYFKPDFPKSSIQEFSLLAKGSSSNDGFIRVSRVSSGFFLIDLSSGGPQQNSPNNHQAMCCIAIYTAMALSYHYESARCWSIQGHFFKDTKRGRRVLDRPRAFRLECLDHDYVAFPEFRDRHPLSNDNLYKYWEAKTFCQIADFLGIDLSELFAASALHGQKVEKSIGTLLHSKIWPFVR